MDIAQTLLSQRNVKSIFDLLSALCEICPATVHKMFEMIVNTPAILQFIISCIKMKPPVNLPINPNDRVAMQKTFEIPHCASDFEGPNSANARILSRK